MLWFVSSLLGLCLVLRTSNLPQEFVARTSSPLPHAAAATASLLGFTCPISGNDIAPEINALSHDIARHFHVAESAAASITRAAYTAAQARGLDPTLVLAVAAVESKFQPHAVNSVTGATGLMQVMPKWHQDKITDVGGDSSLFLIAPNINVGAAILAEYLDAGNGNLENALSHYSGSSGADRYVKLVRLEMAHLTRVLQSI
jgi:soluble lytic murein transglycosylase-like protein